MGTASDMEQNTTPASRSVFRKVGAGPLPTDEHPLPRPVVSTFPPYGPVLLNLAWANKIGGEVLAVVQLRKQL